MMNVLGFEFHEGPEVKPPEPIDHTLGADELRRRREAWAALLDQAIRDEDGWGLMVTRSDGTVTLWDARYSSLFAATLRGYTAHLLLARETRTASASGG